MAESTNNEADAYYADDNASDEDLDLSFLDEDKEA